MFSNKLLFLHKNLFLITKSTSIKFSNSKYSTQCNINDLFDIFSDLKVQDNIEAVEKNIKERKGVGNIRRVVELKNLFDTETDPTIKDNLFNQLLHEVKQLPNRSHPLVETYKDRPHVLRQAVRPPPLFNLKEFSKLAKNLKCIKTDGLNALTGPRSYYFIGALAALEHALIKFALNNLLKNHFELISVPDILPGEVIEKCGMTIRGDRSQIYFLDEKVGKDLCLSGTSEMALAGMISGKTYKSSELPLRYVAVSRCYRSETSNVAEEKGIYRVHQFTKVEMFSICTPEQSESILSEFLEIEENQFKSLELDFQTLDMPRHELGAPAYRKHDIEAWFPARQQFGELSSCSNCTDYQARRLGTRMLCEESGALKYPHTVNGTSCAIPRTIMALFETLQNPDGTIRIPASLVPYTGFDLIKPNIIIDQ